jgi:hypothetical protein
MPAKRQNKLPFALPVDTMEKIAEFFTQNMLYTEKPDSQMVGLKTVKLWHDLKDELIAEKPQYQKMADDFSEKLLTAFEGPTDEWLKAVPEAMSGFRRRSDHLGTLAKIDILSMWHQISFGKKEDFEIPWLQGIQVAEKFMSFDNGGEDGRYIYKGFLNQALIAMGIGLGKESVMASKTDLMKMFEHDFEKDPNSKVPLDAQKKSFGFSKLKGLKSVTSIFRPNVISYYVRPDGQRHPERKPSSATVAALRLREKSFISGFSTFPVWSISDVVEKISPEMKEKFKSLMDVRTPGERTYLKGYRREDLHNAVEAEMQRMVEQQAVTVNQGGNKAAYSPANDILAVPESKYFNNPIERFSTFAHEMAHATKHLLGRPAHSLGDRKMYAAEELVAESSAYVITKAFEHDLKENNNGVMPDEWKECFDDYYKSSVAYNQGWGKPVSFAEMFRDLVGQEDPGMKVNTSLDRLMGSVVDAVSTLTNGVVHGKAITLELRNEAKVKNFKLAEDRGFKPLIENPGDKNKEKPTSPSRSL